ncbi:AAA family ATPase [Paenibacillus mesophilus]|uniref:AAA family ATPase n=1 Tax=Paenibacillus mesophilus TaxID=2582849 RepID=UPI0013053870|nr:AAA family ATPase [Paenibacillus mesophilus]
MNIRDIRIDAFGSVRDKRFVPKGPITLFHGPNEAGKSTIMGLIRAVLFGLPPRSASANFYEPRSGSLYGGSLTLELNDGTAYRVERTFQVDSNGRGKSGGKVKVTRLYDEGSDGTSRQPGAAGADSAAQRGDAQDEALLKQILGGVQSELFRSVFAFGLSELQELGTLQSDEVAGFLYSAGWGAQGGAVVSAERRLAQEMDKLYRPKGKNQEIAVLVRRWEEGQSELRRSKEKLAQYVAWGEQCAQLDREIRSADDSLRDVRESAARSERWLRARDHGLRLQTVDRKLKELPDFASFPHDAISRFEMMNAEHERLSGELREKEAKLAILERTLDSMTVDEALIAERQKLESMLERAGVYKEALSSLGGLRSEADADERNAELSLERLGIGWTAADLMAYPLPVSDREAVRAAKSEWDELRKEEALSRADAGRAALEREEAEKIAADTRAVYEEAASLSGNGGAQWEPSAEAMRRKLVQLGTDFTEWSRLRQELRHLRQREEDYRLFHEPVSGARSRSRQAAERKGGDGWNRLLRPALPAAAAMIVPVLLWLQGAEVMAAVTLLLFAGAAVLLWPRKSSDTDGDGRGRGQPLPFSDEKQSLDTRLRQLERVVLEKMRTWRLPFPEHAATMIGNGAAPEAVLPEGWLSEASHAAEQWLEGRSELERREKAMVESAAAADEARRRSAAASRRHKETEERLALWKADWESWLRERGISGGMGPDGALEWQLVAEQGKQLLLRREAVLRRIAALEAEAVSFEQEVEALCRSVGEEPIYALKRRKAEADAEAARRSERARLASERELLAADAELCQGKLASVRSRIAQLWRDAEADTEERFRERCRQCEEKAALAKEREELEAALDSMLGSELRREAELSHLRPPEELRSELARLDKLQSETERLLDGLRDRRGRLRNEMEKLESGEEHAERLQRVQDTEAELGHHSRRWAVLALASALFDRTRTLYETERQPAVLRRASGYLSAMTGGRYVRIIAPLGEKKLVAVNRDGEPVDSAKLSRGAAEQLYMAMRFALADETAPDASLPFVMDDVFVNFDEERLRLCLGILPSLAEKRQLLLFTCHEHVVREASKAIPQLQVIRL